MHPADVRDVSVRHEALRTSCFISHVRNETNLVPRAFPLKHGLGGPPVFLREKPWGQG